MAALQLTVGGILFVLTTVTAWRYRLLPREEPSTGCLDMVVAGMRMYEMYWDTNTPGAIEAVNAQLPINLDLTDRSAVETFLCDLAGINGFSELSEFTGLPESMLRNRYQMIQQSKRTYTGGAGEEGVRDFLRMYAIWGDVMDFTESVGFNPQIPHYPHGHGPEGSSEEQEQVVVEPDDARSFIDAMVAEHGEDFASDVFNYIGRMSGMGPAEPVNVDLDDLYTAIVESTTTAEFAAAINVPDILVISVFYGIAVMNSEIYAYTMADMMDACTSLAYVLLDLGFFSWE